MILRGILVKIRVYYEDTDCGGVVYHSKYINYCERARSELFFQRGLTPHKEDEFFVVKSLKADYIFPAVLGDELEVKTALKEKKNASLIFFQEIFKENKCIFTLEVKVAYVKNKRPSKIPKELSLLFGEENA